MERYLSNPNVDKTIVNVIQVYEGGTGGTTVKEAQENLDILDKSTIGTPNGLAILPPTGLFGGSIEGGVDDKPMIDGPEYVRTNQTNRFFITNYDIKTGYDISTSMGSIERDNDYLIFKSGPDVGVAKIKVNNLEVDLPIYLAIIGMPFIVSPQSGSDDINSKVEIKTSDFVTGEVDTYHAATDWQLSTTVEMDNIFKSVEKDSSQLTSWNVEGLQENVTYYVRFRYWDNVGNKSSWSEITQFKTRVSFAPTAPVVVDPPNGAKEQKADVTFTTSPFSTYENATHVSSDWQVSTSSVFAGLVEESEANEVNLESWTIGGLKTSTLYYVRVRHTDSRGRKSDWSLPSRFTTRKSFAADTPKIISPVEAEDNHNSSLTIVASHFSNGDSRVTHQSSDWEISEDNSFQYPFLSSYSNSTSKVEWLANKLKPATTYYVRVRYRDTLSFVTDWSKPGSFKTKDSFAPDRPIITDPTNNTENVGPWLDMRTAAFVSNNQGDEHLNSDWEIGTSLVFKDLVKWNTATIDDKIGWRVKGLEEASQYFVRVRHRAIKDGEEVVSDWSPVVKFNTKPSFAPGRPTITYPKSGSKDINENVTFTSTNYEPSDSQDVHVNSDWEISTNSAFTDIIQSNYGSATAKTAWVVTNLKSLTTFFVRVRHRTINDGIYYLSEWSSANNFTVEHEAPAKPVILSPSNGATRVSTTTAITCSAYVAGEDEEQHFSSSWEISTKSDFSPVVVASTNSTTNKVAWNPSGLQPNTTYFVRVKHIGSLGFESPWSDTSQFTTKTAASSNAPTITSPAYGATNVNTTVTFTSSGFSSTDSSDNHTSSDWELATDSSFSNKVKTSTGSNADRTSWSVSGLTTNTVYYVRVRHNGSESGASQWSSVVNFTTRAPETIGQVAKPSITSPSNGTNNLAASFTINASAFSSTASGDSHKATDWEVSKDIGFSNVVKSSYDNTSSKTSWSVGGLDTATSYYLRVRYKGTTGGNSPWSDVVNVATTGGSTGGGTPVVIIETETPVDPGIRFSYEGFTRELNGSVWLDRSTPVSQYGLVPNYMLVYNKISDTEVSTPLWVYNIGDGTERPRKTEFSHFNYFDSSSDGTIISFNHGINVGGNTGTILSSGLSKIQPDNSTNPPLMLLSGVVSFVDSIRGFSKEYGPIVFTDDLTVFARGMWNFTSAAEDSNKIAIYRRYDTDAGPKVLQIAVVEPPAIYQSRDVGQFMHLTRDGSILFALANGNYVYIFSIEETSATYRYRLPLNHDINGWDISDNGETLIVSPRTGSTNKTFVYERKPGTYEWSLKQTLVSGVTSVDAYSGVTGSGLVTPCNSNITGDGGMITVTSLDGAYGSTSLPALTLFFYLKVNGTWTLAKKHTPEVPKFAKINTSHHLGYVHGLSKRGHKAIVNGSSYTINDVEVPGQSYILMLRRDNGEVTPTKLSTPSITSPSTGASITKDATILSSAFSSSSGTHSSSDWEIATDSSFTNIVKSSYGSTTDLTKWDVISLASGKTYYCRVRYISSQGVTSDWSGTVSFSTTQVPIPGANGSVALTFPSTTADQFGKYIFNRDLTSMSYQSQFYASGEGYSINELYVDIGTIDSSYTLKTIYSNGGDFNHDQYSATGPNAYHANSDASLFVMFFKRQTKLYAGGTDNVVYSESTLPWVDNYMTSGGFAAGAINGNIGYNEIFMNRICFDKAMQSFIFPRNSEICIISQKVNEESGTSTTVVTPLTTPPEYNPEQMGQKLVHLSPDGNVAVTVSPFDWVYIFAKVNNVWSFADRFKLPNAVRSCQTSDNGDVIVFAAELLYKTMVYTRKNGVWNPNLQTIWPGGRVDESTTSVPTAPGYKYGCATVNYSGTVISASNGYLDSSNIYFYRLQSDGTYGEIGMVNCTPPTGASIGNSGTYEYVSAEAVIHQLSSDGSRCIYVTPKYTLRGTNGVLATFGGGVKVAK